MNIKKLEKQVTLENQKNILIVPIIFILGIIFLTLIIDFYLPLFCNKKDLFNISCCLYLFSVLVSILILLRGIRTHKELFAKTASLIDKDANSKNRLEASLELNNTEHPLKNIQIEQSLTFFSDYKKSTWGILRFLILILIIFLFFNIKFKLHQHYNISELAKKELNILEKNLDKKRKAKKEAMEKANKVPDFAELALIAPESEMRAKAMDEVAWSGIGNSSQGFKELGLEIAINGNFKMNIPLNKSKSYIGEISFEDEFFLDEVNVEPFDVVTYHLK